MAPPTSPTSGRGTPSPAAGQSAGAPLIAISAKMRRLCDSLIVGLSLAWGKRGRDGVPQHRFLAAPVAGRAVLAHGDRHHAAPLPSPPPSPGQPAHLRPPPPP